MEKRIFISYSRRDLDIVKDIKDELISTTHVDCWMDLEGIDSGAPQFTDEIVKGIELCDIFLFMLTETSQTSKYALRELRYAFKQAEKNRTKHVVIVNIDGCQMGSNFYFMFGLSNVIDWDEPSQHTKLLKDLKRWLHNNDTSLGNVHEDAKKDSVISHTKREIVSLCKKHIITRYLKWTSFSILAIVTVVLFLFANKPNRGMLKRIEQDGLYGFANDRGTIVISCKWQYAWEFTEGLAAVVNENEEYGYIDETGSIVISCKWKNAFPFSEGLASVADSKDKYGFINKSGRIVIPCKWKWADEFSDGLAMVTNEDSKCGFIDRTGKIVIPCTWNKVWSFTENMAAVQDDTEKWGYINKIGKVVIPCQWKEAWWFANGRARVKDENDNVCWIDKTGKVIK